MTEDELRHANEISDEIRELQSFIRTAEMVYNGAIIKESTKYIFKSKAYGGVKSKTFNMNTDLKNRVLDLLRDELQYLKNQLRDM